jgi:CubicO group peptidase (beta-lactamase class C family)
MASTAEDLARFTIALQEGRLVHKETLALMWTRQKTSDGKETPYGLGWNVVEKTGKREVVHPGDQDGVTTFLYLVPDKGFAFVLLINLEDAERQVEIARQVAAIILQ